MRVPSLKKWDRIEIFWLDSAHGSGWLNEQDMLESDNGLRHQTIGYFLQEGELSITVAQSYGEEWKDGTRNTDARMSIPRCAITKITKV